MRLLGIASAAVAFVGAVVAMLGAVGPACGAGSTVDPRPDVRVLYVGSDISIVLDEIIHDNVKGTWGAPYVGVHHLNHEIDFPRRTRKQTGDYLVYAGKSGANRFEARFFQPNGEAPRFDSMWLKMKGDPLRLYPHADDGAAISVDVRSIVISGRAVTRATIDGQDAVLGNN
jgi:hypothetical protein